jgi:PmbA protein
LSELLELAEKVAGWCRQGEDLEVYVSRAAETVVQVFEGEVESLSSATSAGAGVRVVSGGRQGFAYVGSLELDLVAEALEEARDNTSFASAEAWVGLPEPDGASPVSLDLWREELLSYPVEKKVATTLELERQARSADPRIRQVESASWADAAAEMALASSLGLRAAERATACYLHVWAVASDGASDQVADGYSAGRAPSELRPGEAAEAASSRALRMLGARQPRSAHLPVVFEPRVTAQLLGLLGGTFSGERALKGTSLFSGRLGEAVAAPGFDLFSDPTNQAAWRASSFDDEGLASRRTALVEGGVLRGFLYDTTSARRSGAQSTASAVRAGFKSAPGVGARAIYLRPGDLGPEGVLRRVGSGFFVQSVSGLHSGVNTVSGDFSVGAEGLMFRGGELAEPVREVTIASNLQRMLQGVVAIGDDLCWLPYSAAGLTLAIDEMSMSGA